jgi:hypothetical protein
VRNLRHDRPWVSESQAPLDAGEGSHAVYAAAAVGRTCAAAQASGGSFPIVQFVAAGRRERGLAYRLRLIEQASGNEVEKLLENDHVGPSWFLVHTPTEW